MRKLALLASMAVIAFAMLGCEDQHAKQLIEQERQHHLFALQGCIAETDKADEALKEMYDSDPSLTNTLNQSGHDYRAAECMSVEEKTTIEFQRAKHDDYGKCDQCAVASASGATK
jgi:hypothetical protein